MKKNKTSFFIVLAITVLCIFGTLIPTVMNMSMGLNMGRNTIMLFDAKSNTSDNIDSAKLISIFENRAKYIRTNQYTLSLSEDNRIAIEVPSTSEVAWIQEYFSQTMNLEVRGTDDEVLLTADDFVKAAVVTDSSSVYIRLYFNTDKLKEVTTAVAAEETSTDRYLIVWTNYANGDSYADEKEEDTPKYFSESVVSAVNETGYIQVSGVTSETYSKQLAGLMNAGSANYTYTLNANTYLGSYSALDSSALIVGYGTLAALVLVGLYAYLKYKKSGLMMTLGVMLVYTISLASFTFASGVVSIQSLIGLWAGLAVLLGYEFTALKKSKLAALNGRGLESSFKIGYDAITKPLLLTSVTFFILGAIVYFVNLHFVRDFAMMLIIVGLVIAIIGLFVVRGLTTSIAKGNDVKDLGVESVDYANEALAQGQSKENSLSFIDAKKWFKASIAAILVIILAGGVLLGTQTININPDNQQRAVLVVNSIDEDIYLKVQAILSEKGIQNSEYTYATGDAKSWYIFNNADQAPALNESLTSITDATELSAYTTTLSTLDKASSLMNTAMIFVALLVVVFVLSVVFYSFKFAQAIFAASFFAGAATLVLTSLISVGVTSMSIIFAIAAILISASLSYIYLTQMKELRSSRKMSQDQSLFITNVYKLYAESADIFIAVAIGLTALTLSVFALSRFTFVLALPSALLTAILVFVVVIIIEPVLISVTTNTQAPKTKKPTDKKKRKDKEKEELTVIGIND